MHWAAWARLSRLALVRVGETIYVIIDFVTGLREEYLYNFARALNLRNNNRKTLGQYTLFDIYKLLLFSRERYKVTNVIYGVFFSTKAIEKRSSRLLIFLHIDNPVNDR